MKKPTKKRAISKRSKLYQTTLRWKLSHKMHTGKLLPHAHTSYPILAMILLCTGVLMSGLTQVSQAAPPNDIVVSARLPGPAPTVAATIVSPTEGTRFNAKPITVSGTCPADTYIELTRNGVPSGVALCQADLTYSLQTDLFTGANALQAQVYNKTDVPGPNSTTVTVYYDPPVPPVVPPSETPTTPTSPGGTGSPPPSAAPKPGTSLPAPTPAAAGQLPPLVLQSDFNFIGHYAGDAAEYVFSIAGGQAPYAVSIDWGDGTRKLLTVPTSGSFAVEHTYASPGSFQGSYRISISAADARDTATILELIAIISPKPNAAGAGLTQPDGATPNGGISRDSIKALVWSTYAITVLMVVSFWLGERHELHILNQKHRRSHRA